MAGPHDDAPFLRACRGQATERTPVWFMRQAGRSLPEYRTIRGTGTILRAIADPDLATEITLQPVRRYGVDAAILYSDIMTPVHAIGFGVDIEPGVGPVVAEPFRGREDLARLRPLDPEADTPYVLETVRNLVAELPVPLIAFAGAPFTVASYLLEGRPSRTYVRTKALMHTDEALWFDLMDALADLAIASLRSQVDAGASALQLFDSWAGALSPQDYERFVLPASTKVLAAFADSGLGAAGPDRLGGRRGRRGRLAHPAGRRPWACPGPRRAAGQPGSRDRGRRLGAHRGSRAGRAAPGRRQPRRSWRARVQPRPRGAARDRPRDPRTRRRAGALVTVGVVVMAYGTPASPEDIEPYYTHIRRGRPPTPEQLAELTARYAAIGGISPLAQRTRAQLDGIAAALDDAEPGRFVVRLGQKHAAPFIEDAVAELAAAGVERIVGVVLAPHYSGFSVGQYNARAAEAADGAGLQYAGVDSWSLEPAYLDHQAASVRDRLAALPERTKVVFTAHSLPERVLEGDPYPDQLRASAEAIADRVGLGPWATWSIGWQSAGRTPEPWRGPDILEIVRELAATGRAEGILVVPQGFTSDHLEVVYDLDIEAAAVADEVGLAFARTDVVNDDAAVMSALADRLRALVT